jgi:hypothetical protein
MLGKVKDVPNILNVKEAEKQNTITEIIKKRLNNLNTPTNYEKYLNTTATNKNSNIKK